MKFDPKLAIESNEFLTVIFYLQKIDPLFADRSARKTIRYFNYPHPQGRIFMIDTFSLVVLGIKLQFITSNYNFDQSKVLKTNYIVFTTWSLNRT